MPSSPSDPYATLGVSRTATADEIHKAFRTLAKKHHPDLNPGSPEAEARFKAASAAHELLTDAEKRAQFDRGEINAEGQPNERAFYRQYAEGDGGARYRRSSMDDPAFADIFSDLFARAGAGRGGGAGGNTQIRGQDQRYALSISFLEAANGGKRHITMPEGDELEITVPPGTSDGQILRLRGRGQAGWNGGPPGDALIEISVLPHPFFSREGRDIHLDLPVTIAEAVLGAKVTVPTLAGPVTMSIPARSDAGRKLRLRGRGIPTHGGQAAGDLYATLTLVIGEPDEALESALRDWSDRHHIDPRAHLLAEET